jgi:radical SAM superfamily enzyme YgiQ (UPF0313 family)
MRITFIRPQFMQMQTIAAMEPLVFAVLAGLTPPGVDLDLFDERLEPIPDDLDTDLVALTVETYTARRAYQIATHFRRRGIPVVMGGYHPTFLPDEALVYADAVVIGEAEGVWAQLVRDVQMSELKPIYRDPGQPSLDGLEFDRSIFKGKRYRVVAPVQYGRGCRYACNFCSIHAFYGSQTRQRPVAEVVAEIKALHRKYIIFVDDNLFVDVPRAEELFQALIPLNIHWGCQISIDIANHPHLLDLMAESGCFGAVFGFESLNEHSLKQMNKGWNLKHCDYGAAIDGFRERGMMIYASFIFGYDHDTVAAFDHTVEFAIRSKFALANLWPLDPMPGSKLYDRLMHENRLIFERWWLDPDYRFRQATFRPLHMTADELAKGWLQARRKFFGFGSILRRALDPKANSRNLYRLGIYLGANLGFRHAISYKLGRPLGAATPLDPRLEDVPLQSTPCVDSGLKAERWR